MTPRIAVLHHRRSFSPFDLLQEFEGRVEPLWVLDDEAVADTGLTRILPRTGTVVDIADLDLDKAAAALAEHRPDGIVSFVDDHLVTAAELAARLGLRYHTPEVARVLMDKRRQRAALDGAGVPGPAFWTVPAAATADEVRTVARAVDYPAVLKPAEGSGSQGMCLVHGPDELEAAVAGTDQGHLVEAYLPDGPTGGRWYASYLSVESVVSYGCPSHVAVTGRFPLASEFRETGNFIPALLDAELEQPVFKVTGDAIAALGITDAVVHTEIKLTDDGPKLVEVNGRLGGRPPFVLRSVSDVNLFAVACQVAAGIPFACLTLAPSEGVGFQLMLQPPRLGPVQLRRLRARPVRGAAGRGPGRPEPPPGRAGRLARGHRRQGRDGAGPHHGPRGPGRPGGQHRGHDRHPLRLLRAPASRPAQWLRAQWLRGKPRSTPRCAGSGQREVTTFVRV